MPYLKYNLIFIYTNPILSLEYYFREGEFMFKSLLNMHHTKIYTSAEWINFLADLESINLVKSTSWKCYHGLVCSSIYVKYVINAIFINRAYTTCEWGRYVFLNTAHVKY